MKALAFALMAMLASTPTLAEPNLNRAVVNYEDLDLRSPEGRAKLDRRLEDAVKAVCRTPHSRSVRVASETQACIAQLREDVSQLRDQIMAEAQNRQDRQDKPD
jgi:UrcA family protein